MRLIGRSILITGGASGIGLATAEIFQREGARVALLDCNGEALEAASAKLNAAAFRADIAREADVQRAVTAAVQMLGRLDGVVNAAGVDLVRAFDEMPVVEWQTVLSIDLTGPMLVCRAVLPALKLAGRGTIVNIASGAALRPLEHRSAYCAAKAGLVMFSKSLAIELAPFNIRANALCPGIIDTPMFRASFESAPDPETALATILQRFVIKHPGQPEDIGYAALYLTSDESSHVTGSVLAVDGGRAFH